MESVIKSQIQAKLNLSKHKIYLWPKANIVLMKEMASNLCSAFLETCFLSTDVEVLSKTYVQNV